MMRRFILGVFVALQLALAIPTALGVPAAFAGPGDADFFGGSGK
ncbi:MAG: hypothetical protein QN130_00580 [Armatimonadota bacterium]|nr:hypothetical protein [Armatimonadota bacterium]MDR7526370.1 hypothetical protein [Armatimonadota bacterium]